MRALIGYVASVADARTARAPTGRAPRTSELDSDGLARAAYSLPEGGVM